jgi:hypothetical protein
MIFLFLHLRLLFHLQDRCEDTGQGSFSNHVQIYIVDQCVIECFCLSSFIHTCNLENLNFTVLNLMTFHKSNKDLKILLELDIDTRCFSNYF